MVTVAKEFITNHPSAKQCSFSICTKTAPSKPLSFLVIQSVPKTLKRLWKSILFVLPKVLKVLRRCFQGNESVWLNLRSDCGR